MLNKNDAFNDLEVNNVVVDFLNLNSCDAVIFFSNSCKRVAINSTREYSSSSLFWILENALAIINSFDNADSQRFIVIENLENVGKEVLTRFKLFDVIQKLIKLGASEADIIDLINVPKFVLDKAKEYNEAMPIFENNLKEVLKLSNMDAEELSLHLNMDITFVEDIINERAYIDSDTLYKLCNLFELQPKDILKSWAFIDSQEIKKGGIFNFILMVRK